MYNCRKCGCEFSPTLHQINKSDFLCLGCRLTYEREYRERRRAAGNPVVPGKASKEFRQEYNTIYAALPSVKKRNAQLAKKYREDPKKRHRHKARWTARHAVASGRLVRLPCEMCGDSPSEAHHDDYSKPLEVRWLCRPHHREHHAAAKGE